MILNIGLDRNDGKPANAARFALDVVMKAFSVDSVEVARSASEETLVVRVRYEGRSDVSSVIREYLCRVLAQDCIAVWFGDVGELIGPKPWGAFNHEFFILPSEKVAA